MGEVYYTLVYKRPGYKGSSIIFTNLRRLEAFVGNDINYWTVYNHFREKDNSWWEDPYTGIMIFKSLRLVKGLQRVKPRGGHYNGRRNLL